MKIRWYQIQLLIATALQFLVVFAPLAYAGNYQSHKTAILHPAWISLEQSDWLNKSSIFETVWVWQRIELTVLVLWMLGLGIFLLWQLFSKMEIRQKNKMLGSSMGGFAAQVLLAYFVARSAVWQVEGVAGDEVELVLQPEFFLLLFPMIFAYLAYLRQKKKFAIEET